MPRKTKDSVLYQLTEIPMSDILMYQNHEIGEAFLILLKVPSKEDRFLDDHRHYTKSNLNVCYSAPRSSSAPRSWYETQLNVSTKVRKKPGYPYKNVPFYAVTDDGYVFLAHTVSEGNKQFAAVGDELILGKWIKGRLVKEKLVEPCMNTSADKERKGMITKEMLNEYGCNALAFQKTDLYIRDPDFPADMYEVWTLKLIWSEEDNG